MKFFKLFKKRETTPDHNGSGQMTRTESLHCIPVRSETAKWHLDEEQNVLIEYPITLKPFFLSIAKRFNRQSQTELTKKLQLDSTGSQVWQQLDGSRNVKTIIKAVAKETGLSPHEAELSVTTFLRELGRRGVILILGAPK